MTAGRPWRVCDCGEKRRGAVEKCTALRGIMRGAHPVADPPCDDFDPSQSACPRRGSEVGRKPRRCSRAGRRGVLPRVRQRCMIAAVVSSKAPHIHTKIIPPTWQPRVSSARSSRVGQGFASHLRHASDQFAGEIPSMKLFESEKTFAFLDINPLSKGHAVSMAICQHHVSFVLTVLVLACYP